MITIEMLPAEYGDCLWIEYGDPGHVRRLLIDGGTHGTYDALRKRIETLHPDERVFELLVVTHIDNDHIDGLVRLLQNPQLGVRFGDVWFNGWPHIREPHDDVLGPVQGEYLSARIAHRKLSWNQAFRGGAVAVAGGQELPRIPLTGGLQLVLLSPTAAGLASLRAEWYGVVTNAEKDYPDPGSTADWLRRLERDSRYRPDDDYDDTLGARSPNVEKLLDEEFLPDTRAANGSSIAFLLEYGGGRPRDGGGEHGGGPRDGGGERGGGPRDGGRERGGGPRDGGRERVVRCLFAGDAHSTVLESSIRQYLAEEGLPRLPLDAFKVPHHGSQGNVSPGLLELLQCRRFLISTNSRRYGHPDAQAIARIVAQGGPDEELVFNYAVEQTKVWNDARLRREYRYRTLYPPAGREGISIEL